MCWATLSPAQGRRSGEAGPWVWGRLPLAVRFCSELGTGTEMVLTCVYLCGVASLRGDRAQAGSVEPEVC